MVSGYKNPLKFALDMGYNILCRVLMASAMCINLLNQGFNF